ECQLCRRHAYLLPAGMDAFVVEIDFEHERIERPLRSGHDLAKGGTALEKSLVQPTAQAHERNLGQSNVRLAGVEWTILPRVDHLRVRRGIVELMMGLVRCADQYMGEPVLGAREKGKRVPGIKPHGLAAARNGNVQRAIW